MSDYSKSPLDLLIANQQKGYVGLHIEQGVPLLDRDLNLLHDLITATVRSVITRYIGNGIPAGADGFAIQALPSPGNILDFRIKAGAAGAGTILVGGIEVTIPADTTYKVQTGVAALTIPSVGQPDPRTDIVYLDVFFVEVDGATDADLNNSLDVGMQTSVRLKTTFVVLVSEGVPVPAAPAGHFFYPLAQLQRPRGRDNIDAPMITDLRQSRLTVSDMEKRMSLMEKLLLMPAFAAPGGQILPRSGNVGDKIDLKGRNFDLGTPRVTFNGTPAVLSLPFTAADVKVFVPNVAIGTYSIAITTDGGGPVTAVDQFIVAGGPPPPPPLVPTFNASPFAPRSANAGVTIVLAGTNFDQPGLVVTFDGTVAALVSSTAIQISVKVPNIPVGGHTITVATNAGSVPSPIQFNVV